MAAIMQGTTPSITVHIDPEDFLLSAVTKMELYVKNGGTLTTYTADDLTIDTDANTLTRTFTEGETAALNPKRYLTIQGRFWLGSAIVGINKLTFDVADMMGVGADG